MELHLGFSQFSSSKVYKRMIGHRTIDNAYGWLWRSSCQMKHKVFFWLFLKDRLNTRGLLQRKNMELDSYTCDLCIWQYEETIQHLFHHCNFAKACWAAIEISMPISSNRKRVITMLKRRIDQPFAMEVIILMTWAIWRSRNDWIFNSKDPSVETCKMKFISEFKLLLLRAKKKNFPVIEQWLDDLAQPP
jgi:hypothetical protein